LDCPIYQNKDKSQGRKEDKGKGKKTYISWEDNDMSSSSDTSEENKKKVNLCFMENGTSSSDSVSVCSTDFENYDNLLLVFHETHEEANKLVVIGNKLKSAKNFIESKVKSLEKYLHDAQTKLVNLELICLHATCKCVESSKKKL